MFGWLRRRLEKEHRKLGVQTFLASTDLEMLTISLMKGYDARAEYEEARLFTTSFILKIASTKKLTGDEIESAFAVNKSLRRLFDTYGRPD